MSYNVTIVTELYQVQKDFGKMEWLRYKSNRIWHLFEKLTQQLLINMLPIKQKIKKIPSA